MEEKDIFGHPPKLYAALLGLSVLGGFVSWYAKVRRGEVSWASLSHLIGELTTSAFAGILAFLVCEAMGTPAYIEAALVGIAGHAGARAIEALEAFIAKKSGVPFKRKE